ncbi:hypothetical protein [Glycomyces albidus]|uniref:Uncharacterized protein n=1 Tax=Glycomyces albidus TaxID=2656774 RepID=A0A6L5G9U0_9ACTN|nr:hypothetical protein [Glycomyces albidus]MQM26404.1 hypothetical protein [Glycomyces albidus]
MSDIEFAAETYGGVAGQEAVNGQDASATAVYRSQAPCSNPSCTNTNTTFEEAWIKLVSAIPVTGQIQRFTCVAVGTAAPTPEEVRGLVAQVRPDDEDRFALREISRHWMTFNQRFAIDDNEAVGKILEQKLTELSNGWQGTDFDAFAEQMETVFANCAQIQADIGDNTSGLIGLLEFKAEEIFALQGGESYELPYPAPQYWVEDEGGLFSDPTVHHRVPFKDGDCEITDGCSWDGEDDSANRAMELGGFNGDYANELGQYVADQTEAHLARLKRENPETPEAELRTQAEQLATQDGDARAKRDYDSGSQDYQARAAEQNDTVLARWEDAEIATQEFTPTVEPVQDTTFRESGQDLDGGGYSPPTGGDFNGSPTSSGSSGLTPPPTTTPFGSGGSSGTSSWNPTTGGDEETSGGLAGGGLGGGLGGLPGGGAGGGLPGGGAGGGAGGGMGGAGMGLFGPAVGSTPGAGAGAGAGGRAGGSGLGKGSGLFGKTTGAGGAGMMGGAGGRPGAGGDENAEGKESWLTEDEDVWGLARFEDENDPLA